MAERARHAASGKWMARATSWQRHADHGPGVMMRSRQYARRSGSIRALLRALQLWRGLRGETRIEKLGAHFARALAPQAVFEERWR